MPQTILIGANDPNIAYLLQRYAEESGFQTAHVRHSHDLVALAFRLQPAVIILDLELAGISARELVRQLKNASPTRDIPIVIYSFLDEQSDDWREWADGYLRKSVLYDDFAAVLTQVVSGKCPNDDASRVTTSSGD